MLGIIVLIFSDPASFLIILWLLIIPLHNSLLCWVLCADNLKKLMSILNHWKETTLTHNSMLTIFLNLSLLLYRQVQCIHHTYKLYSCTYKLYSRTVGLSSHPALVCTFSKHTQHSNKIQEKVFGYIPPGCNILLSEFCWPKQLFFWKFRDLFPWT